MCEREIDCVKESESEIEGRKGINREREKICVVRERIRM